MTAACPLLELGHDELSVLVNALCDPLRPYLALQLSGAAKGLHVPMRAQIIELRQQHESAKALASLYKGWSCSDLRDAEQLLLGDFHGRPLSPAHWRTLGNLAARQCLRSLGTLVVIEVAGDGNSDEGVALFSAGLRLGSLPSLTRLGFSSAQLGPRGASALAAALTERAVPALKMLRFGQSSIGDAGLVALSVPLRRLPRLQRLWLFENGFGDEGLAALLAEPLAGVLGSLEQLDIHNNLVSTVGCAALAAALIRGALPALEILTVEGNPASKLTQRAVGAALSARAAAGLKE